MDRLKQYVEQAAVYGVDKYVWYSYMAPKPTKLKTVSGKHSAVLKKGTRFGVRPASSKKGVMRLIVKDLGKTIVFSFTPRIVQNLTKKAKIIG